MRNGFVLLFSGILLATLAPGFFDGFVKGLFQGAGIALLLIATVFFGAVIGRRKKETSTDDGWLPSRDGDS